ncbi:MAG: hypothetical protein NTX33_00560 [Propionibacteriales bacterium]|nr:hypothetical protein [Propionibacteriales bacterium]
MSDDRTNANALLDEILGLIPEHLHSVSGTALYTGRQAWSGRSNIYLLGYNPGGSPGDDRMAQNLTGLLTELPADYSEYRDGRWGAPGGGLRPKGTAPMQRRVLHLFNVLGVDPGSVPASNVIFPRSARAAHLPGVEANRLADECWTLHETMIERLGVKVIVCMGSDAANLVRPRVGAHTLAETYRETYDNRSWASNTYTGAGPTVVQLTHPSFGNWLSQKADPTGLVVRALARSAA